MGATGIFAIIQMIKELINVVMPLIIAMTVLVFIWGIFRMVTSSDGAAREEARGYITWGIVALFVMVSVWGLVNILVTSLHLNNSTPQNLEQLIPVR
ncbi:MAG: pilin [Candidatus Pacebacteria bacterium]|nr:pilin [Candidatus Paceibacterota bacterium]